MSSYEPRGVKKIFHNTRRLLAKNWLNLWKPLEIAVTGSQGKTNTSQTLKKVLSRFGNTVATDLNLDTLYNVPITALRVLPWTKYLIWELGIDHPGEMDTHLEIARPMIAIITGISPVHTDAEHLGSLESLVREKRKLIEALPKKGVAILNYDNPHVRQMASYTKAKVLTYGSSNNYSVYTTDIAVSLEKTSFIIHDENKKIPVSTKLIGPHHIYTIMAAYLVVKTLFPNNSDALETFIKVINDLHPLRGRMSVEKGPLGLTVLNDALRANPESVLAGLKTLSAIKYTAGKKIAVLGVMGELSDPKKEHELTGRQIVDFPPDIVVCLGDWRKYTYQGAIKAGYPKDNIFFAKDVFEAAEILKGIVKKGDLVYLKGSFLRNLKRILLLLNNEKVCCRADVCPYEHCGY